MVKKKITIKEVAKLFDVLITTVSLILNGNMEEFSPKTIRKILAAEEKLGYRPDYFARQMITKETKTVGVLVPDITNPFFSILMQGIEDTLYKQNFVTMLCNADSDHQREIEYLVELTRRGVDGFIIATSTVSTDAVNENLKKQGRPFIILDQKKSEGLSGAVRTDDSRGGCLAGMHLPSLGHQTIIPVYPENPPENVHARIEGSKSTLDIYQISHNQLILSPIQFSKQNDYQITAELLDSAATGMFALDDELAFGLYRGLKESGKSIPEDYSIIGYDDIDICEYIKPKLTTIVQPIFESGQTSAKLLLDRARFPEKRWGEKRSPIRLEKKFSAAPLKWLSRYVVFLSNY